MSYILHFLIFKYAHIHLNENSPKLNKIKNAPSQYASHISGAQELHVVGSCPIGQSR